MTVKQITSDTADELMEQREQSQACLVYAESRQKKTESQKIKQLYETAFPEDERIPWDDLMCVWWMKCRSTSRHTTMKTTSSASPSSILVSLSTGTGTLPYVRNFEAKAMVSRY